METDTASKLWRRLHAISDLYSPDPIARSKAASLHQTDPVFAESGVTWRYGIAGAANAWLVLVGPSPGAAGSHRNRNPLALGDRAWDLSFADDRNRNVRWRALLAAGFGRWVDDPRVDRAHLAALMNLSSGNHPNSITAKEQLDREIELEKPEAIDAIRNVRPRVLIALSWKVWDHLCRDLGEPKRWLSGGDSGTTNAFSIRISEGVLFETLVVRSPQHPSQPFFKVGKHDMIVRRTVERFLPAAD